MKTQPSHPKSREKERHRCNPTQRKPGGHDVSGRGGEGLADNRTVLSPPAPQPGLAPHPASQGTEPTAASLRPRLHLSAREPSAAHSAEGAVWNVRRGPGTWVLHPSVQGGTRALERRRDLHSAQSSAKLHHGHNSLPSFIPPVMANFFTFM